ncbi:chemotaxis protein [Breoghania sp.]|uniref:chemotaxis protein n=1 Tax=Breoghania sp. TaxID=2065378 RepID=UPI002AAAFB9C|nr:chemotaxis protein [Breoghania sp.]
MMRTARKTMSFKRASLLAMVAAGIVWAGVFSQGVGARELLGAQTAGVSSPQPYEMVRSLQSLQAQVAHGNSQANAAQRTLLKEMREVFENADPEVWQDARNARASVIYLLSGGHPAVMHKLLGYDPLPHVPAGLMHGALAYIEGRAGEARKHLSGFDPLELEAGLGGQVALVRAALFVREDPQEAIRMLDIARLLMPGTLVEEAALRREVFLVGKLGDIEKLQSLSLTYMRRFHGSLYGNDFRRRFAAAIDTLGFGTNDDLFSLLESLLSEFDIDSRRSLYVTLSRHALLNGRLDVVKKATAVARPLAMAGTDDAIRLNLYRAGALLGESEIRDALRLLWSIDRSRLSADDEALMDAIYERVNQIRHWPQAPEGTHPSAQPVTVTAKPAKPSWETPLMKRAQRDIDAASRDVADRSWRN